MFLFERLLFVLNNCKFFILKEVLQIKVHLVLSQIHFLHHTVYKQQTFLHVSLFVHKKVFQRTENALGFWTDYDETCWKRYWGEIFQKPEKLTFQPFNLKFEGRTFNACRTQLKITLKNTIRNLNFVKGINLLLILSSYFNA